MKWNFMKKQKLSTLRQCGDRCYRCYFVNFVNFHFLCFCCCRFSAYYEAAEENEITLSGRTEIYDNNTNANLEMDAKENLMHQMIAVKRNNIPSKNKYSLSCEYVDD